MTALFQVFSRATSNSEVLSLNLTGLIILLVLKVLLSIILAFHKVLLTIILAVLKVLLTTILAVLRVLLYSGPSQSSPYLDQS